MRNRITAHNTTVRMPARGTVNHFRLTMKLNASVNAIPMSLPKKPIPIRMMPRTMVAKPNSSASSMFFLVSYGHGIFPWPFLVNNFSVCGN